MKLCERGKLQSKFLLKFSYGKILSVAYLLASLFMWKMLGSTGLRDYFLTLPNGIRQFFFSSQDPKILLKCCSRILVKLEPALNVDTL